MHGLPDFESNFDFHEDGSCSVSSVVLTLNHQKVDKWRYVKNIDSISRISALDVDSVIEFLCLGHTFYIVDKEQEETILRFFEKYMGKVDYHS